MVEENNFLFECSFTIVVFFPHLAHASHRDAAEGPEHVGFDSRRRFEHKDTAGPQQVHRDLGDTKMY